MTRISPALSEAGAVAMSGSPASPHSRSSGSSGIVRAAEPRARPPGDRPLRCRRRRRSCSRRRRRAAWRSSAPSSPARDATSCAAGCGVVTTIISARGSSCPSEIATSPVPGGMSTTSTSSSSPVHVGEELLERAMQHRAAPHHRGVVVEEETDRHQLEVVLHRRDDHLVDEHRLLADAEHVRDRMSVDVRVEDADLLPGCAKATARFAVSVDLPTPPLPLHTASTRVEASSERPFERSSRPPRSFVVSAWRSSGVITSKRERTRSTPVDRPAALRATWFSKSRRRAGSRRSSARSSRARRRRRSRSPRTMSSSVTGLRSSGSMTRLERLEDRPRGLAPRESA